MGQNSSTKNNTKTCGLSIVTQTNDETTSTIFWGLCDCKNNDMFYGTNLDELIGTILKNHITQVYIHDFQYVVSYIVDYIINNGFIYNDTGDFRVNTTKSYTMFRNSDGVTYYLKLFFKCFGFNTYCEFKSSKMKTMSSLRDIARSYDIDVDYNLDDIYDYSIQLTDKDILTNDMMENCLCQSYIVARVIKKLKNQSNTALTIGSDAMKNWIKLDGDFSNMLCKLDKNIEDDIRKAYRGGYTWLNDKYSGVDVGQGVVYDVNSLFPYVMRNFELPYGIPTFTKNPNDLKGGRYSIIHLIVTGTLKENSIPCISNLHSEKNADTDSIISNEYLNELNNIDLWLTNFDFELLLVNYDIISTKFLGAYIFEKTTGLFNNFIDYHYNIKKTSHGAKRQVSKLMLDSLYGRFGIKTDKHTTIPRLVDGSIEWVDNGLIKDKTFRYLPMSIFITSIARYLIIDAALSIGLDKLIYVDTDSLHVLGTDIPDCVDLGSELGQYKIEAYFTKARYIGLKTYIHDELNVDDNTSENYNVGTISKTVVKMAGAPENVRKNITWDNFKRDTKIFGKCYTKTIPGGIIRKYTWYRIVQI